MHLLKKNKAMPNLNKKYILDKFKIPATDMLVFINGLYQPPLSDLSQEIVISKQGLVELPKNGENKNPLHFLFLSSQNCQVELDVIAKEGSYTTIIEECASLDNGNSICDINIKFAAGPNSKIIYYRVNFGSSNTAQIKTKTLINQEERSGVEANFINNGSRNFSGDLVVKLIGEQSNFTLKEINILRDNQIADNHIKIEHLKPRCKSEVLSKGVIDDWALNNFNCRIVVQPDAVATETHVINKNLLLSSQAKANSAPELEVYVDDVICTHGATVGQLDEDALFYLRSRGIAEDLAKKVLTAAFIQEIASQFIFMPKLQVLADLAYE